MADEQPDHDEWIDIDAARALTGRTRDTLMRWKRDKPIATRTEDATFTQRQKRVLFRKADLLKAIGADV